MVLTHAPALMAQVRAQSAEAPPVDLDSVVVTATRNPERTFDVAALISRIDAATLRDGQPMVNLSEALARVPGLTANNRQNYAQDLQVSSRGFGARAAFGVRGVRLYQDDIPATMPDGQGQTGSFRLLFAESIEVLRGPFSALYGNASGGVISLFTEEGKEPPRLTATVGAGSYGAQTAGLKANGASGSLGQAVALSRFQTDRYRPHSASVRELANLKLTFNPRTDTRLTLIGSHQDQPESEDPLGLTRSQWERDPRQADPAGLKFATRKTIRQTRGGASLERWLSSQLRLKLLGYGGLRTVRQYLAFAAAAARSSGGVTDLQRDYEGVGARLTWSVPVARGPLTVSAGFDLDQQRERRRGFVNLNGAPGDLRRDEDDRVANTDGYAQAEWTIAPAASLMAGARVSSVAFRSDDHYVSALNPDTSGRRDFHHTSPVAGALWHLSEDLRLYASHGAGFETPTLREFAYRPGGAGLNFALAAARSRANEVGLKAPIAARHRLSVALFATDTEDEIVVSSASGGRTTYKNAGPTRRRGLEAEWRGDWGYGITTYLAYTHLRAEFATAFASGRSPVTVAAGTPLPGVPRRSAYGEIVWAAHGGAGFQAAIEAQHGAKVLVNDQSSDAAPAYSIINARLGFERRVAALTLRGFVRGNNLGNRKYAGSVIVGDANGRYFEPAPGRNWFVGGSADAVF